MMRRSWMFLLPAALFALVVIFLIGGLNRDPNLLPSPLINEPAPAFSLPSLAGDANGLSSADLTGKVSLVNFFASWCVPCRVEHPVLNALSQSKRVAIYGINYKDKPEAARAWITELGNPYTRIGADSGRVGIEWGIYGVPETFVVDRYGRIRYKQALPLTPGDIERKILPLIAQLEK